MTRYWSRPSHSLFLFPLFINIFRRNNLFLFSSLFRLLSSPAPLIFLTDTLFFFFPWASGQWQQLAGVLLFWVKVALTGRKTLWRRSEMKKAKVEKHTRARRWKRATSMHCRRCVFVCHGACFGSGCFKSVWEKKGDSVKNEISHWCCTGRKPVLNSSIALTSAVWTVVSNMTKVLCGSCAQSVKIQRVQRMDFYINCRGQSAVKSTL